MSVVPRQSAPVDDTGFRPPEDRRHMIIRRWLTAIVIVLLIGIPAGYLVVSAEQSRDSGRDKAAESSATGLRESWPSQMKRRIFEVPIPSESERVAYFETSNWKTSRLYVQFTTSSAGLDHFLESMGTSRAALQPGLITIGTKEATTVGWTFTPGERAWTGLTNPQDEPRPTQHVVVDLTKPERPRVYVVSTTTP
ncbi:hypothetical protein ACH4E8_29690 [Streptomyces sp. NPDC017979]|uniref:hypothetical protein n=1 Tax=Streptomyces sp. NPDC017979 TaxID=3365024 RepID=UPI0037A65DA1